MLLRGRARGRYGEVSLAPHESLLKISIDYRIQRIERLALLYGCSKKSYVLWLFQSCLLLQIQSTVVGILSETLKSLGLLSVNFRHDSRVRNFTKHPVCGRMLFMYLCGVYSPLRCLKCQFVPHVERTLPGSGWTCDTLSLTPGLLKAKLY